MKFVAVFLFVLVCFAAASPPDAKPEPEANTSEETPPAPVETDGTESTAPQKPKCTMFITRMFGRDFDGNGGYFNRRFPSNFMPSFSNDRESGLDGNRWFSRRTPYFVLRRGNGGRGSYNPNGDQPDSRDIEFVQS